MANTGSAAIPGARRDARAGLSALPARRRRDFAAARRHSLLVRILRIGLPIVGIATVAFMAVSTFRLDFLALGLDVAGLRIDGSTVTMDEPELTGYREGRGSYRIRAAKAEQDIDRPDVVNLTGLDGRLNGEDGNWARLQAGSGQLHTANQTLRLTDRVIIQADGGYRALLDSADVDIKAGTVVSNQPIKIDMLNGSLSADTMSVERSGQSASFEGGVKLEVILGVPSASLPAMGSPHDDGPGNQPSEQPR